jgi:hypothetical protein
MANQSRYSKSSTNKAVIDRLYLTSLLAALSIVGVAWLDTALKALAKDVRDDMRPAITTKLPNVPGKSLSAVLVSYPPEGRSAPQHHAGSVFAYVVSGKSDRRPPQPGQLKSTSPAKAFLNPRAVNILLVKMPVRRSPPASWRFSLRTRALG